MLVQCVKLFRVASYQALIISTPSHVINILLKIDVVFDFGN